MSGLFIPLVPRHADGILRACILGRKSRANEANQNESISASIYDAEQYLSRIYNGETEILRLGEQISGMVYDRQTIRDLEDRIDQGWPDLILVEDIGRLFRNPAHIHAFPQDCIANDVRFIAIADGIDTADDDWEANVNVAASRHGFAVPDARRRVKRSATYSFHGGGMVQKIIFGYRKLSREEARSGSCGPLGLRICKLPEWTAVIREMADRAIRGEQYVVIAERLNESEVPTGEHCKSPTWTARLVRGFLLNPLLGGLRTFRNVLSMPTYGKSGGSRRRKNPNGPLKEHYAELAHLEPERHAALVKSLDERAGRKVRSSDEAHPRYRVPRKRTLFPAQHARCGICNGLMYTYGRGQMKCENSHNERRPRCWNHAQFDSSIARDKIVKLLVEKSGEVPQLREKLVALVWAEYERQRSQSDRRQIQIAKDLSRLEGQASRLAAAISEGGELAPLMKLLQEKTTQIEAMRTDQTQLAHTTQEAAPFSSRESVCDAIEPAMQRLATNSHRFADLMRELITRFDVFPVQAIDSGLVRLRARLVISFCDDGRPPTELHGVVDLFHPPAYIAIMQKCLAAKRDNPRLSLKKLATLIGEKNMTVKRSLDLAKRLEKEGLNEPYRELLEPPTNASRWRHCE